jgi:hypothetical protein
MAESDQVEQAKLRGTTFIFRAPSDWRMKVGEKRATFLGPHYEELMLYSTVVNGPPGKFLDDVRGRVLENAKKSIREAIERRPLALIGFEERQYRPGFRLYRHASESAELNLTFVQFAVEGPISILLATYEGPRGHATCLAEAETAIESIEWRSDDDKKPWWKFW